MMTVFKNILKLMLAGSTLILCSNGHSEQFPIVNTPKFLHELAIQNPGYTFEFKLPINVDNHDIRLNIKIPKNLKLQQEKGENPHLMQYGNQDTLITINHQTGGKFQASDVLNKIIRAMQAHNEVTILEGSEERYSDYRDSYKIVTLHNIKNNTNDIVYVYAASGPYDSATILYEMRIAADLSVDVLKEKLKSDFKMNVGIIGD